MSFTAPWSNSLKVSTLLVTVLLLSITVVGIFTGPQDTITWFLSMVVMPPVMLLIFAFFAIRGYAITNDSLFVQRIGWNSTINLAGLESATVMVDAMDNSFRTFGNGGAFCFAGKFHNRKLGPYRAFATDPKRSVVLKWSNRTVVVTPNQPDVFVAELHQRGLI
ncbi:hypothetical protein KAH55_13970 [bacterium]|nr:hypothetical protein [bacterium]